MQEIFRKNFSKISFLSLITDDGSVITVKKIAKLFAMLFSTNPTRNLPPDFSSLEDSSQFFLWSFKSPSTIHLDIAYFIKRKDVLLKKSDLRDFLFLVLWCGNYTSWKILCCCCLYNITANWTLWGYISSIFISNFKTTLAFCLLCRILPSCRCFLKRTRKRIFSKRIFQIVAFLRSCYVLYFQVFVISRIYSAPEFNIWFLVVEPDTVDEKSVV